MARWLLFLGGHGRCQSGMLMANVETAQEVAQDDAIQRIAEHTIFEILVNVGVVVDFDDYRTFGGHLHVDPVQAVANQIGRLHRIAQ